MSKDNAWTESTDMSHWEDAIANPSHPAGTSFIPRRLYLKEDLKLDRRLWGKASVRFIVKGILQMGAQLLPR